MSGAEIWIQHYLDILHAAAPQVGGSLEVDKLSGFLALMELAQMRAERDDVPDHLQIGSQAFQAVRMYRKWRLE